MQYCADASTLGPRAKFASGVALARFPAISSDAALWHADLGDASFEALAGDGATGRSGEDCRNIQLTCWQYGLHAAAKSVPVLGMLQHRVIRPLSKQDKYGEMP
jgi:hypothetical protein